MQIKDIIAVSGVGGLSRLASSRTNGLLLENLDTGKTKFFSTRKHQFTPLETVSIYTMMDTAELKEVLSSMKALEETTPVPSSKESNDILSVYFEKVLPEYDKERVYPSDIKKIIKWYSILKEKGLLEGTDEEE
jgi:hypothetical protein